MKLSIAMCTYNGALYVREQLDSIAAQTRPPDELIICDDRSTDRTREIVEAFASETSFPVRLYVNERNLGSTSNFEKAIEFCEGEVIALADQDDVWHPEKLKRVEAIFSATPGVGLVFADAEVADENLQSLGYSLSQSLRFGRAGKELIQKGRAFELLLAGNVVAGATMVFRSDFRKLVLPIPTDIKMIHDGWISLLISAVAGLAFIDEPLIKYRQHPQQQIGAKTQIKAGRIKDTINNLNLPMRVRQSDTYSICRAEIQHLKTIHERLSATCGASACREAFSLLETKMAHFEARAGMPENRLRRVPRVLKELLTLRYHLYSKGMYSAAKDLLL